MKIKSIFLTLFIVLSLSSLLVGTVLAEDPDELIDKIEKYEEKIHICRLVPYKERNE